MENKMGMFNVIRGFPEFWKTWKMFKEADEMAKGRVQYLSDGSCICEMCWGLVYPDKPKPQTNWEYGKCDYCTKKSK